MRNSGNDYGAKRKLKDDVDELFKLPLAEFIGARNALAAQLKKSGQANDANLVKTLAKPSVSAWAVNQLYWNHRAAFDRLFAAGERFRQAQTSRLTRKVADMRVALDARREALSQLADLATALLTDAGHNPSPDTIRRITSTLEAMSAYASVPDGPRPGRLTYDVDPPGFESLASFVPSAREPASTRKPEPVSDTRELEETHKAKIAAAKVSLQEAKSLLAQARGRSQSFEAVQKKANAEAKEADKRRHEAEERLEKARAASEEAAQHARNIATEVEEAAKALEDAERSVKRASKELEELF